MNAMSKVLTAITIANLRPRSTRYEVSDLGCRSLRVVVFPSGARSFVCRYRFEGQQRKLTLGPCLIGTTEPVLAPELDAPLTLVAARSLCAEAIRLAKAGIDPCAVKRRLRQTQPFIIIAGLKKKKAALRQQLARTNHHQRARAP